MDPRDKAFERDDPLEFVGVLVPAEPGHDWLAEQGRCIAEEFALMGWTPEKVLRLFRNPHYAGPHALYRRRGEPFVRQLIASVFGATGQGARA